MSQPKEVIFFFLFISTIVGWDLNAPLIAKKRRRNRFYNLTSFNHSKPIRLKRVQNFPFSLTHFLPNQTEYVKFGNLSPLWGVVCRHFHSPIHRQNQFWPLHRLSNGEKKACLMHHPIEKPLDFGKAHGQGSRKLLL